MRSLAKNLFFIAPIMTCSFLYSQGAAPTTFRSLAWERTAELPDPAGLKGIYSGTSNGRVILAGGSNFPVSRSEGGKKAYARSIFTRPINALPDAEWNIDETTLAEGMAEGASVTTERGVVVIGGNTERGASASVYILSWDETLRKVTRRALPPLPEPVANAAAACWQGKLYVAGGETAGRVSAKFRMLDLAPGNTWRELPAWPGDARFGAVMAALKRQDGARLFLFGGRRQSEGAVAETDYLADGFAYDFKTKTWKPAATMPHRALQPAAFIANKSTFVVMGGSDGHDLARMAELGERYRLPDHIMIYDAVADKWRPGGVMPLGTAAASVAELGAGGWLVAGGEFSPALRTRNVYIVKANP